MKKRLLCFGFVIVLTQLVGSGCFFFHPVVDRWRENHPCGTYSYHPLLHPIQTRRAIFAGQGAGHSESTPVVGAPVMSPPCHGCSGGPGISGIPVGYDGSSYPSIVPITNQPTVGYPMPLQNGPKVYPLPMPSEAPKGNGNGQ